MGVERLKGVGEKKQASLREVGIESLLDLLTHYPRRYIDRTREATIAELTEGEEGMVLCEVTAVRSRRMRNRRTMVEVDVSDGSGRLVCVFFNQPWRERQLKAGMRAVVFGRLESYRGKAQMTNPVVDLVGDRTGRIVPVYPQSEKAGINTWDLGRFVAEALRRSESRGVADPVPQPVLDRFGLIDRAAALRRIHDPETMEHVSSARTRLVFDELLRIQVELVQRKRELEASTRGVDHQVEGNLRRDFLAALPFKPTAAQLRVIDEIAADLEAPSPMHRLLQGDVGSGKTLVAVVAVLMAVQGGHQGALMAPTEVLAEQHALGIRELLAGVTVGDASTLSGERPLAVELLTNRASAAERRRIAAGLADGSIDFLVGTHALIQEGVDFASLGVVVIDEQHRFGVEQRAALRAKGNDSVPDVLVMTATPIPRTAAMTVYGDLDVSVLDEMPPGRTPITTSWARTSEAVDDVWVAVRSEVEAGFQAYVVCPLIEESEKLEVASAEETYAELTAGELAGLRVGLLHGRLRAEEKDATMSDFRAGRLDVLVATTVVEVGVDVSNATVMVILDADRFGIAQLHQLRGRVGRGDAPSQCFLVGEGETIGSEARLGAMVETTDGFELAEVDLDLRGEGTLMGERQKGRNDLKLASLRRDREWVIRAREVAFELVDEDLELAQVPMLGEEITTLLGERDADFLMKS